MMRPTALLLTLLLGSPQPDTRIRLTIDTSEAEAVLAILARQRSGGTVSPSDWDHLFATEPYRRLKQREGALNRVFADSAFQRFALSDSLATRAPVLARTLSAWKSADLERMARRVLGYLPMEARIHAKVFPVIKPQTNSFVFEPRTDPAIFLYLDPALTVTQFENTVAHELHHIGLASVSAKAESALRGLKPSGKRAAEWLGAFGEGVAMLAAAGGPDVHPHHYSPPADRARWDRDLANFAADLRAVERFLLDVADGRLTDEAAINEKGFSFFGVQGPWYTVGWRMAVEVERAFGREVLIECMLDPRQLLVRYNQAVARKGTGADLPVWSSRLLDSIGVTSAAQ